MLSLPALFGVLMAPGLVLLMTSIVVAMCEQDSDDKSSFHSMYPRGGKLVK